jgi:membrane dipeptidase
MLLFDAHLDLSMNALEWNRDLTRPARELRPYEEGMTDKRDRGAGTVSLPDMRRGGVGLCVATLIGRYNPPGTRPEGWPKNLFAGWQSPEIAWAQTQGQLAWYRAMEDAGQMVQITDTATLDAHVALWQNDPPSDAPIGYVLSLEGADSIRTPAHLQLAYEQGLRAIGPAHYGPGRYAQGTNASGGLTPAGRELLAEIERLGIILDATHLCDESFWEALEHYDGRVWASHNNCRALVPGVRQFSDEQIRALIARGAVVGAVLDAWMLMPDWIRGETRPEESGLSLEHVADQIDHVCQLAGNARHAGVGSDLDGGFGREQCPADVDTIADLARLPEVLAARGYPAADVAGIMHGNWIRFLRETWGAA